MEKIQITKYPMPEYSMVSYPERPEPEVSSDSAMERLAAAFESHEEKEQEILRRYRSVVRDSENPFIEFLFGLIIADEEKHHWVTRAMLSTLKGDLLWSRPQEAIRGLSELRVGHRELLKLTEEFIQLEKKGIRTYRKLMKESESYYYGLFAMLFAMMIRDSEKHVEILKFLKNRLKEA
jgi:rubrerythrin